MLIPGLLVEELAVAFALGGFSIYGARETDGPETNCDGLDAVNGHAQGDSYHYHATRSYALESQRCHCRDRNRYRVRSISSTYGHFRFSVPISIISHIRACESGRLATVLGHPPITPAFPCNTTTGDKESLTFLS